MTRAAPSAAAARQRRNRQWDELQYVPVLSCPLQDFLETLEDLDLSYNNLVDIPWDTVSLLVSVNTLSLDHNLIESVPEGIFSNLHKLARYGSVLRAPAASSSGWIFSSNSRLAGSGSKGVRSSGSAASPIIKFI